MNIFVTVFIDFLDVFWTLLAPFFHAFRRSIFQSIFDRIFGGFVEPKWSKNGSKNGPRNYAERAQSQERSLGAPGFPPGTILDPFWTHFGPILDPILTPLEPILLKINAVKTCTPPLGVKQLKSTIACKIAQYFFMI